MIRVAVELSNLLVIYEYLILLGVPERGSKRLDAFLVNGDGCFIAHPDEWLDAQHPFRLGQSILGNLCRSQFTHLKY
jgi:hypothetical protein